MEIAFKYHKNQVRKYTGNPYTDHLAEVTGIVAAVTPIMLMEKVLAVAWLHDAVEDTDMTLEIIEKEFDKSIANGVAFLTDIESLDNRATRKSIDRVRLSGASASIQNIKVADMISNTSSIVNHDPKFAVTYLEEKRLLLDVLTKADPRLVKMARDIQELAK